MVILGLTGSIGMGKTTTAEMFRQLGVPVFDSDAVVHRLYETSAVADVEAAFPGVAEAGKVDRTRLSARVLNDPAALRRLESIVHPRVAEARAIFLRQAEAAGAKVAVIDVPLLFETGGTDGVDAVIVVSAPESVQKSRVLARPGMTEARFAAILQRQMPDAEKRARATYVIETGQGLEAARLQVAGIVDALRREKR